jgi:hypothetical protein
LLTPNLAPTPRKIGDTSSIGACTAVRTPNDAARTFVDLPVTVVVESIAALRATLGRGLWHQAHARLVAKVASTTVAVIGAGRQAGRRARVIDDETTRARVAVCIVQAVESDAEPAGQTRRPGIVDLRDAGITGDAL